MMIFSLISFSFATMLELKIPDVAALAKTTGMKSSPSVEELSKFYESLVARGCALTLMENDRPLFDECVRLNVKMETPLCFYEPTMIKTNPGSHQKIVQAIRSELEKMYSGNENFNSFKAQFKDWH